jgi:hypothetical protein
MRSAATASTLPARLQRWAPFWVADGDDSISRKPASRVLESLGNGRPASCHARPLDHPVRFSFGILDLPSQQQMREPIGTNSRLVNSSSPEMLSDRQGHAWSTLVCFLSPSPPCPWLWDGTPPRADSLHPMLPCSARRTFSRTSFRASTIGNFMSRETMTISPVHSETSTSAGRPMPVRAVVSKLLINFCREQLEAPMQNNATEFLS